MEWNAGAEAFKENLTITAIEVQYRWVATVPGQGQFEGDLITAKQVGDLTDGLGTRKVKGRWRIVEANNLAGWQAAVPEGSKGPRVHARVVVTWSDRTTTESTFDVAAITKY